MELMDLCGLTAEEACRRLTEQGIPCREELSVAPRTERTDGTLRVVRVCMDGETAVLTVCRFLDGIPARADG